MIQVPTGPIPDALLIPAEMKRGRRLGDRLNFVSDIAEPLLGVDRSRGEHAYVRTGKTANMFITKDPNEGLYHATTSHLRGRHRYNWVMGPDGIRRGYKTPECLAEEASLIEEALDPNRIVF